MSGDGFEFVGRAGERHSGFTRHFFGERLGESDLGVEPGADRGAALGQLQQPGQGVADAREAVGDLAGIAGKLLPQGQWRGILQMGAANLDDLGKRLGLAVQSRVQMLQRRDQLVLDLVRSFYAHMAQAEPELAATHELNDDGTISERTQERFGRFLVEWLGGPQKYSPVEGHPRLRMRHHRVPIDTKMRDAWLRCMQHAMDDVGVTGEVRTFLDGRFAEVADFLRNTQG